MNDNLPICGYTNIPCDKDYECIDCDIYWEWEKGYWEDEEDEDDE